MAFERSRNTPPGLLGLPLLVILSGTRPRFNLYQWNKKKTLKDIGYPVILTRPTISQLGRGYFKSNLQWEMHRFPSFSPRYHRCLSFALRTVWKPASTPTPSRWRMGLSSSSPYLSFIPLPSHPMHRLIQFPFTN